MIIMIIHWPGRKDPSGVDRVWLEPRRLVSCRLAGVVASITVVCVVKCGVTTSGTKARPSTTKEKALLHLDGSDSDNICPSLQILRLNLGEGPQDRGQFHDILDSSQRSDQNGRLMKLTFKPPKAAGRLSIKSRGHSSNLSH